MQKSLQYVIKAALFDIQWVVSLWLRSHDQSSSFSFYLYLMTLLVKLLFMAGGK